VAQRIAIVGVIRSRSISSTLCRMLSGLRPSLMHPASRTASPSRRSTPRRRRTPPFDDNMPPSNATLTFLPATDGRSNGSGLSSLMTGVALLNSDHESVSQPES